MRCQIERLIRALPDVWRTWTEAGGRVAWIGKSNESGHENDHFGVATHRHHPGRSHLPYGLQMNCGHDLHAEYDRVGLKPFLSITHRLNQLSTA